jgi:alkylhydroperoxidase family enzyme
MADPHSVKVMDLGSPVDTTTKLLAPIADAEWPRELEALRGGFASELNVYRVMAHHPALLQAWTSLRNHLTLGSTLSARWRELAILRTARFIDSRYEWIHHVERGRASGLTDPEIAAVGLSDLSSAFGDADTALLKTTDALLKGLGLSALQVDVAAEHMSAQQLLDLMATVGMYLMLGFLVKSFRTPLEKRFEHT